MWPALLFIFAASSPAGGSVYPTVTAIEMPTLRVCQSVAEQLKETPKPGNGYAQYTYKCVEKKPN